MSEFSDDVKYPDIEVQLVGTDGNAYAILGRVSQALKDAGVDPDPYLAEAMSGDYDNLLRVSTQWVSVS